MRVKRIGVVDFEGSGLTAGYSIEIGWSEVGSGVYQSFLIKPAPDCEEGGWDLVAWPIHHIKYDVLEDDGYEPDAALFPFFKVLDGAIVVSDTPKCDQIN